MSRKAPALGTQRWILPGLVAVALLTRLAAALFAGGDRFWFVDETRYVDAAQSLREGTGFPAGSADVPGYPAFLALLGVFLPAEVLALRIGQALLVAFGGLLCFDLGRRLGGRSAGLTAAALYSLDPLLVVSAALLYPEATAALLLGASLVAAWEAIRSDRISMVFVAGGLLGVFTLFRPVGLVLAPAMVGWLGLAPGSRWRRRAAYVAVLLGIWALVLAPWVDRNYRVYGRLLPNAVAVRGVPAIGPEVERSGVAGAVAAAVQRDPLGFTRRTISEFGHFWELYPTRLVSDDSARRASFAQQDRRLSTSPILGPSARDMVSALSFGFELALAAVGVGVGWRARRRETVWLVALVLSFAVGYAIFYGKLRYRIPILPIVLGFAGLGAASLGRWLNRARSGKGSGAAGAGTLQ